MSDNRIMTMDQSINQNKIYMCNAIATMMSLLGGRRQSYCSSVVKAGDYQLSETS